VGFKVECSRFKVVGVDNEVREFAGFGTERRGWARRQVTIHMCAWRARSGAGPSARLLPGSSRVDLYRLKVYSGCFYGL